MRIFLAKRYRQTGTNDTPTDAAVVYGTRARALNHPPSLASQNSGNAGFAVTTRRARLGTAQENQWRRRQRERRPWPTPGGLSRSGPARTGSRLKTPRVKCVPLHADGKHRTTIGVHRCAAIRDEVTREPPVAGANATFR